MQGQFALIPHLPLAACTMSPMLYKAKGIQGDDINVLVAPVTVSSLFYFLNIHTVCLIKINALTCARYNLSGHEVLWFVWLAFSTLQP